MASELPELRASDADRERVADLLRHAGGEGRLTVEELDERLDQAYAARTLTELETLTLDIVPDAHATSRARAMPVRPAGPQGTKWLISIMSGRDRKGHWRLGPKLYNINFWGGSDLDLNDAELTAAHTEIHVIAIMAGADVRVPDGLDVTVSEFSLMGGNDIQLGRERPVPGGPTVHLRLFTLMGGTNVKRGRRLTRAEKREQKLAQREQRRLDRRR